MKHCALIYNPVSGNRPFENHLSYVKERLSALGFTCNIYKTDYPGHATEIVKTIIDNTYDLLIVAGGDGTFHEMLNGLVEAQNIPLVGYLPTGTSCDIGKSLGIPKRLDKALDIIAQNISVNMDIVKSNHGFFTYVAAVGSYIDISYNTPRKLKKIIGYPAYFIMGIKEFFTIKSHHLHIAHDQGEVSGRFSLALFVNSQKVAGFKIVRNPVLDDGKIDVVLYHYTPFLNNLLFLFSFVFGFQHLPRVTRFSTKRAKITMQNKQRQWNQDGEAAGKGTLELEVLKQRLPILIHPKKQKLFKNQRINHE